VIGVNSRVHAFARPETKEAAIQFYTGVLGGQLLPVPGGDERCVVAFRFSVGTSLSIGFTNDALDDEALRRGAWLEAIADEPYVLQERVLEAGLRQVDYPGSNVFYFQAPGGQVWRIVSRTGELVTVLDEQSTKEPYPAGSRRD
jgi:hypothetical protein